MLTDDETAELAKRRLQLLKRTDRPGYRVNCEALRERIAELETKQAVLS